MAKRKLKECSKHLVMAHLINDYLEGFYGTKNKPSEELDMEYEAQGISGEE